MLYLTRNRGAFLRKCPGTKAYRCCGYQILHIATYCTMDCAYCILQAYFHPPVLQLFINREELLQELDTLLQIPRIHRIGTGEFTDSLIWEACWDLTPELVRHFGRQQNSVLELKTKTNHIGRTGISAPRTQNDFGLVPEHRNRHPARRAAYDQPCRTPPGGPPMC